MNYDQNLNSPQSGILGNIGRDYAFLRYNLYKLQGNILTRISIIRLPTIVNMTVDKYNI